MDIDMLKIIDGQIMAPIFLLSHDHTDFDEFTFH